MLKLVIYINFVFFGFYLDLSIIKVGEYYYLVFSIFEYFLGILVFCSKDLVNWEQIGYVIDWFEQLFDGVNIFVVILCYYDGMFYIVIINVGYGWNFIMIVDDLVGFWFDFIWIDIFYIDFDLFFDDDGKVYVINFVFILYEIDIKIGKVLNEIGFVWVIEGGCYVEGLYIYKKDGWYYLMVVEGGIEEVYFIIIVCSYNIVGLYYSNLVNFIVIYVNCVGQ